MFEYSHDVPGLKYGGCFIAIATRSSAPVSPRVESGVSTLDRAWERAHTAWTPIYVNDNTNGKEPT
ncbi:hypothetical protein Abr02nite_69410 [Paractinoplanes brasiliensis]|nr:hypothetical protein Abr02nite_69410 [Actinoplanes brasiliensis]